MLPSKQKTRVKAVRSGRVRSVQSTTKPNKALANKRRTGPIIIDPKYQGLLKEPGSPSKAMLYMAILFKSVTYRAMGKGCNNRLPYACMDFVSKL